MKPLSPNARELFSYFLKLDAKSPEFSAFLSYSWEEVFEMGLTPLSFWLAVDELEAAGYVEKVPTWDEPNIFMVPNSRKEAA